MHLPPKTQWFLTEEQCENAVTNWENQKTNFGDIKELINPTHVFYFTEEDRAWIKEYNNGNKSFPVHAGVNAGPSKNSFVLMIGPNENKEYLAVELQPLKNELTLVETPVFNTTISKDLEINSFSTPGYNHPAITERAAVKDIESWKYDCLSWFYNEISCGRNIFNGFSVPFPDLYTEGDSNGEVIALFGLKFSFVFQKVLPVLIFVDEPNTVIMRPYSNTKDWSSPSPPFPLY